MNKKVNSQVPSNSAAARAATASSIGTSGRRAAAGARPREEEEAPPPPLEAEEDGEVALERPAAAMARALAEGVPSQHFKHTRFSDPVREDSKSFRF